MKSVEPSLARAQTAAWLLAAVGVVGSAVGWTVDRHMFAFAHLIAFMFWQSIAVGLLAVLMLQHVVRSSWGQRVRPWLNASASVLPILALFFVPVVINARELYEWTHAGAVARDPLLQHKHGYLNLPAFVLRSFAYLAGWSLLARWLAGAARSRGEEGWLSTAPSPRNVRLVSGVGLVFFVLSSTFSAIDWVRSLAPHWVSSTFGLYVAMGQQLAAFAATALVAVWLRRFAGWSERIDKGCLHDLGKLLFASVSLWAYIAFTQYLIIWSGSIPEETEFYSRRLAQGYGHLATALIMLHFAVPFVLLTSQRLNERAGVLAAVAAGLLSMRAVDLYWLIAPSSGAPAGAVWSLPAPMLALGGIWSALTLRALQRRSRRSRPQPSHELAEVT